MRSLRAQGVQLARRLPNESVKLPVQRVIPEHLGERRQLKQNAVVSQEAGLGTRRHVLFLHDFAPRFPRAAPTLPWGPPEPG